MTYRPQPLDLERIVLSEELSLLIEQLARNAHETWSARRIADGWTHGSERNDPERRHPCLVSYSDLPDGEREYDRVLVTQVIKGLIALGYRIERG